MRLRASLPRLPLYCVVGALLALPALAPPAIQEAGAQPADADSTLQLEQYLEMEDVYDPRLSPDGDQVVYVRSWIDPMHDTRKSAVWIMGADGSRDRHLVEGSSPRWSPSGDRLAFLACGTPGGDRSALQECGEDAERQIWVRIMEGDGAGSVTQVTRLTEGASDIAWSPDGERVAFNRFVEDEDSYRVELPERPEGAEWTEAPRVVDRLDYRQDGAGFTREGHDHVFTVSAGGGTPRQVTHGPYDHGDPRWSPDGSTIYVDGLRTEDAAYEIRESEVYAVDVDTREVTALTDRNGPDGSPAPGPDGEWIAYTGADSTGQTYQTSNLYVMRPDGSGVRELAADFDRSPGGLTWAPDGSGVYFTAENEGTEDLYYAGLNGDFRRVTEGQHVLGTTDINDDGTAVGVMETPKRPGDVVTFDVSQPDPEYLTAVNEDVLSGVRLGDVEEIWYESVDGFRVQGWIVKPPDFDPSEQYPLILHIHGGPHAMYDVGFSFRYQHFASEGYVTLYTNPRGSTGYGTEFGNAINHAYPGRDYDDLMVGVDSLIDRGYIDADNMLATGCSGGGVLSSWIVTQTDRFAAAVVRCPVTNWLSFVGTTDSPYWYYNFRDFPWEDPTEHLERSPLMQVGQVETPTLLMTGVNDLRTPMPQTEEFYQALKLRKVPTKMIRMKDEWHGTGSNPSNFMRTQLHILKWFESYMTGDMKERMQE
ncbi:MAG: S9 family peptidase [Candidatus Palauibacterales bacterium]|nr:S9 family peptidase [Candidatus Palauibacterales bacterium]